VMVRSLAGYGSGLSDDPGCRIRWHLVVGFVADQDGAAAPGPDTGCNPIRAFWSDFSDS
jgi:hypothetical protein